MLKLRIDQESPIPKYYQLKSTIKKYIREGKLKEGERLPSERELADRLKVGKLTVVKAFSDLVNEGLVYRQQGRGTFIKSSRTGNIALITPFLPYADSGTALLFYGTIINCIASQISQEGYNLSYFVSQGEDESLAEFENKVDGFLVLGEVNSSLIQRVKKTGKPLVVINGRIRNTPCIVPDDFEGAKLAAQHLIELGHKHILLFKGKSGHSCAKIRFEAWKEVLSSSGIPVNENLVHPGGFDPNSGYASMRKVLRNPPLFTAVLVPNDSFAIGAIEALREKNIKIPQQISIVGFDDIEMSRHVHPTLTTVRIERRKIADIALEKLFHFMQEGKTNDREGVKLPCNLIVRESTARVPNGVNR